MMWIIPKVKELSVFVPVTADSSSDFEWQASMCERSLMWRSKHSQRRTWSQRLKRVYWLRLLCGRILRPSLRKSFEEKYTASLPGIPAHLSAARGKGRGKMIRDTFGHILQGTSVQLDLFGVSSKTYPDTSRLASMRSSKAYVIWVMRLRLDCLQRQRLEHPTGGQDCLSWATPATSDWKGTHGGGQMKSLRTDIINWGTPRASDWKSSDCEDETKWSLTEQVRYWPTPAAQNYRDGKASQVTMQRNSRPLQEVVINWPTPEASEARQGFQDRGKGKKGKQESLTTVSRRAGNGLPAPENPSMTGKRRGRLNPAWVEQLMGLPPGWTSFDSWATASSHNRPPLPGGCLQNPDKPGPMKGK